MTDKGVSSTAENWIQKSGISHLFKITKPITGLWAKLLYSNPVQRNIKLILFWLALWILIAFSGYVIATGVSDNAQQSFLNQGTGTAMEIGERIRPALLEDDLLALTMELKALNRLSPIYGAVLDHFGTIVAHTNPQMINQQPEQINHARLIKKIEDVTIEQGNLKNGMEIVQFSRPLLFSNVTIGHFVFGFDSRAYEGFPKTVKLIYITFCAAVFIIFSATVAIVDKLRRIKSETSKINQDNQNNIGPYRLKRKIAVGGMSELHLAEFIREDGFKKIVAIKMILPHLAQNEEFIRMFIREARLAAMLQHPNIVQIYDLVKRPGAHFISMEYVHGRNLAEIIKHEGEGLPVEAAVFIIQKISAGLYYSHSKVDDISGTPLNIIHRDITPQNMLISFKGEVKISDFGISKARSEPSFTVAGSIKGKLSYLSPEQALGKEINHQSDLYALGIIFYEILSGKRLYHFDNEIDALRNIPKLAIPPIMSLRKEVPEFLNDIVHKCLHKNLGLRYQNAKELHNDLIQLKLRLRIAFDESDLADFMIKRFRQKDSSLKI